MILRSIVAVVFCIGLFGRVLAASYSNVYFQLGSNSVPTISGAPGADISSQIQLAPLTLPSIVPLVPFTTLVAPCPPPCINPSQPVNNAKLIAYVPANTPMDDGTPNYGYSYVIVDDGKGDKKPQYEVSDYTAEDLKGFRAVVTNLLNGKVISSVEDNKETKDSAPLLDVSSPPPVTESVTGTVDEKPPQESEKEPESTSPIIDVDKGEQLAEVQEIKPPEADPSQETPVTAAVEEIKAEPIATTNDSPTESNNFDIYGNIIKCIQTSMKNSQSPLAYIILPTKPCT